MALDNLYTGTGIDYLTDIIMTDPGLRANVPAQDIYGGAVAAAGLNGLLVHAIDETGVGDDGVIEANEVGILDAFVNENYYNIFMALHGDDEDGVETGFHLVQNDGATTQLYGENAVDTVADGLYHIGFGGDGTNLTNEDGNANATYEDAASWLNQLFAEELADGFEFMDPEEYAELLEKQEGLENRLESIENRTEHWEDKAERWAEHKKADILTPKAESKLEYLDERYDYVEELLADVVAQIEEANAFDLEDHFEDLPLEALGFTVDLETDTVTLL